MSNFSIHLFRMLQIAYFVHHLVMFMYLKPHLQGLQRNQQLTQYDQAMPFHWLL